MYGANSPRMLVARADDEHYMTGLEWCDRPQTWSNMLRPDVDKVEFDLISGSDKPFRYRIKTDCSWLEFSKTEGEVSVRERITLSVNKALLDDKVTGTFEVENIGYGTAHVTVEAAPPLAPEGLFLESDGYICIEARHFFTRKDTKAGAFKVLRPYGRSGSAVKAFPSSTDFFGKKSRPSLEYRFCARENGQYELTFELAPTTPVTFDKGQFLGYSLNGSKVKIINTVKQPDRPFFQSVQWASEAKENVKKVTDTVKCVRGENTLTFYGMSPGIVLEKMVLVRQDVVLPQSYLGPRESYINLEGNLPEGFQEEKNE